MKLIFCPYCQDVVRLFLHTKKCDCGKCWGRYINDGEAVYSAEAIPLGIDNHDMVNKVHRWKNGRYDNNQAGVRFEAFVIPPGCKVFSRTFEER